jgi:signal transduction histidine kinase
MLPFSSRPWRALAYLVARLPFAGVGGTLVLVVLFAGLPEAAIALALLAAFALAGIAAAPLERQLVALLGRPPVPAARPARLRAATHALLAAVLAPLDAILLGGWLLGALALLASPLLLGAGPVSIGPWEVDSTGEALAAMPAGLALLFAGAYAVVGAAEGHAALAQKLLGPRGEELRGQVQELTRSRLRLIDAFDVERRRIERDLHDGAQQQLVALALTLDLARIELEGSERGEAARLVEQAHTLATRTLTDLRDLIQGIHPPVLADRGLPGAVAELSHRSALEVTYAADLPGRLPESVETAAYFVLSEAMANAAKHSGAPAIDVSVSQRDRILELVVRDEGRGGADAGRGSGLAGLGDRVAAVGGRLTLSSPLGGPTIVRAEIPCP